MAIQRRTPLRLGCNKKEIPKIQTQLSGIDDLGGRRIRCQSGGDIGMMMLRGHRGTRVVIHLTGLKRSKRRRRKETKDVNESSGG